MKLKNVYVRFYKSFNYDYLKKNLESATRFPWEFVEKLWFPYVTVPMDKTITAVVGANGSGKSHLLDAIEKGITGGKIKPEDFCRYTEVYSVEADGRKWPDFGFEWYELTDDEKQTIKTICKLKSSDPLGSFHLFRNNKTELTIYLKKGKDFKHHQLDQKQVEQVEEMLPNIIRLDPNVALPNSVPIRLLTEDDVDVNSAARRSNKAWYVKFAESVLSYTATEQDATKNAKKIYDERPNTMEELNKKLTRQQVNLTRDLICEVAGVHPDYLEDLARALNQEEDGHAEGIVQQINASLAKALNFPARWVQDKSFQLMVKARDTELAFTIRDRTETEYKFAERSSGLQFFLSYYVQYLAHKPHATKDEILLMDEPDTKLSSQAQHDLLKIFDDFANPDDPKKKPINVVYVTHSPFLIDKNHADRIRVVEKGVGEEGTRVVNDAARNHYEPLRSAFGAYVAETTFIGNSNLMVEGIADQILIAGMANHLRKKNVASIETIDLNRTTIVPAGGAQNVPYMVYLARGRDEEKPAIIVLLDSDDAGDTAKKKLLKGPYKGQILDRKFVLQLGDLADTVFTKGVNNSKIESENLIPASICVTAVRNFVTSVYGVNDETAKAFTIEKLNFFIESEKDIFSAVQACFKEVYSEDLYMIEKAAFSRNVVEAAGDEKRVDQEALTLLEHNFKQLFIKLNEMKDEAEDELNSEKVSQKLKRYKKTFLQDHETSAKCEHVYALFRKIRSALEDDVISDALDVLLNELERKYNIKDDLTKLVKNYDNFKEDLGKIEYLPKILSQETLAGL